MPEGEETMAATLEVTVNAARTAFEMRIGLAHAVARFGSSPRRVRLVVCYLNRKLHRSALVDAGYEERIEAVVDIDGVVACNVRSSCD